MLSLSSGLTGARFLLLLRQPTNARTAAARTPRGTPTPIPALAPVDRPDGAGLGVLELAAELVEAEVGDAEDDMEFVEVVAVGSSEAYESA